MFFYKTKKFFKFYKRKYQTFERIKINFFDLYTIYFYLLAHFFSKIMSKVLKKIVLFFCFIMFKFLQTIAEVLNSTSGFLNFSIRTF